MDEESNEIRLRFGKQGKDQLFALVPAVNSGGRYYWIKTDSKGEKALTLEGILRYGNFDNTSPAQMFRF